MNARNPYLRRIASSVGEKDQNRAVKLFVDHHRQNEPLDVLARRLGVSRIIEQRLPFEGGLFMLPDGELVIKLNCENSYVRKRFTLAHEIGHLLLDTTPALRSRSRANQSLERTCDMIAAEILMPMDEVSCFARNLGGPSPENLKAIAAAYRVSLQTAAIRMHFGLRLWKCCVGFWERQDIVRTAWFVGPKRWDSTTPDSYSFDQAINSAKSVKTNETWMRNGSSEPVGLFLLHTGTNGESGAQRFLGLVSFLS